MWIHVSILHFVSSSLSQLPLQGVTDPLGSLNFWLELWGVINGGGPGTCWGHRAEHPVCQRQIQQCTSTNLLFPLRDCNLFFPEYTQPSAIYFVFFKHYFLLLAKPGHRWKVVRSERKLLLLDTGGWVELPRRKNIQLHKKRPNCIVEYLNPCLIGAFGPGPIITS